MKNNINLFFKKYKQVICIFISYFSTLGFSFFLKIGAEGLFKRNFCNNIIYLFLFIISIFFSVSMILGVQLDYFGNIFWNFSTIIKIFLLNIFNQIIIIYLISFFNNYKENKKNEINIIKFYFIIFNIIFIFWFLTYLALFPRIYEYDGMH